MTTQDLIDLNDGEIVDLGVASELTEGNGNFPLESQTASQPVDN